MIERDPGMWARTEGGTDELMSHVEDEHRRLDGLGAVWRTETTTVMSKDRSFSMTFDGRGDLSDVSFNGTRYRRLAPAELSHMLLDTFRAGRLESLEKMAATMGDSLPGVDLVGLALGRVEPREVLDSLMGPIFEGLGGPPSPPHPAGRAEGRS